MSLKKRKKAVVEAVSKNAISGGESVINWQMDRLAEESSELIQAIMKVKRYPDSKERMDNLYEELSHVSIAIDIIIGILGKGTYKKEMSKKISQFEKTYNVYSNARKD